MERQEMMLTAADAAARLGVKTARVYELVRTGLLPAVRLGRQVRIDPYQLSQWINSGGKPLSCGWRKEAA